MMLNSLNDIFVVSTIFCFSGFNISVWLSCLKFHSIIYRLNDIIYRLNYTISRLNEIFVVLIASLIFLFHFLV